MARLYQCTRAVVTGIAILLAVTTRAQVGSSRNFTNQFSLVTENDRYLMQGKDRYYTNGIMLNYSRAKQVNKSWNLKRVNKFELGQQLYTPYSRKIYTTRSIDRPITGYLYGKYLQSNFIKKNQLLEWGVSVGTIGKAALGEGMQDLFHKMIHVDAEWYGWIWKYQLNTEAGINLHGRYAKGLLNQLSFIQVTPVTSGTLGTNFTNISQGILLQLGKFNEQHQNSWWNASVEAPGSQEVPGMEWYFFYYPEIKYQFYNATIQGGFFRDDKGPHTSGLEDWVMTHQVGAAFAMSRYTVRLSVTLESKEAQTQRYSHDYGSILLGYRFN